MEPVDRSMHAVAESLHFFPPDNVNLSTHSVFNREQRDAIFLCDTTSCDFLLPRNMVLFVVIFLLSCARMLQVPGLSW